MMEQTWRLLSRHMLPALLLPSLTRPTVFALPKASKTGLASNTCDSTLRRPPAKKVFGTERTSWGLTVIGMWMLQPFTLALAHLLPEPNNHNTITSVTLGYHPARYSSLDNILKTIVLLQVQAREQHEVCQFRHQPQRPNNACIKRSYLAGSDHRRS